VLLEFPEFRVVGEAGDGFEAVNLCRRLKPDVIFLDIDMPKLNGFDVLELIAEEAPDVVFVTAYDQYAVRAFETEAVDYILKPVTADRLSKTIARLRESLTGSGNRGKMVALLDRHRAAQAPIRRILIQNRGDVSIVPCQDVVYIQAKGDYVLIVTAVGRHMKLERLSRLERLLDPGQFVRVHRSHILNIKYVKKIEPYSKDDRVARLTMGGSIPVSRSGFDRLMVALEGRDG
jgi:two-component system LytT family response regulator